MRVLSLIVLAFWLLSLARTILNLLLVPRLRPRLPRTTPLVSVIVPARNEERSIGETVRALLAQTYPHLELVVVNDRSTDRTGEILRSFEDRRLVVVDNEEPPPGWLGKPWALHQGSLRARGAWLLFVDADVSYAAEGVGAAVAFAEESGAGLVSLFPYLRMEGFWEHIGMPNLTIAGFMFTPLWIGNRTRIPLLAIGGGPGNLVRREVYDRCGGHEALRDAIIDDIGLARLVRRGGERTQLVRADDLVSLRMYHGLREIVDGFTKNAFAAFGGSYALVLVAMLLGAVMNVLPFALALTGDLAAIASVAVISLTRLILFASLRYRIDNALFGHPLMMALWGWIMLRSVWFTGIRRQISWRGRTYGSASEIGRRPRP
jgi:chlorobactene glucosyltransferase